MKTQVIGKMSCGCWFMDSTDALQAGTLMTCRNCRKAGYVLSITHQADLTLRRDKPHLRLHYKALHNGQPSEFNWSVEYVRGPAVRARSRTYPHNKAWGALMSAASLWF